MWRHLDGNYWTSFDIDRDDYIVTEGSTIVTLKNSYLKSLGPGEYEVQIDFIEHTAYGDINGDATAGFTIVEGADPNAPEEDPTLPVEPTAAADSDASESTTPKTGDNSNMVVYVSAAMAAAAGIVTVVVFKKKSNA